MNITPDFSAFIANPIFNGSIFRVPGMMMCWPGAFIVGLGPFAMFRSLMIESARVDNILDRRDVRIALFIINTIMVLLAIPALIWPLQMTIGSFAFWALPFMFALVGGIGQCFDRR